MSGNGFLLGGMRLLEGARTVCHIGTLGPSGTSSEYAAKFLVESLAANDRPCEVHLFDNFEQTLTSLLHGDLSFALVPNAYASINTFYINPHLKLTDAFVYDTPSYSLVGLGEELPRDACTVAIHPATAGIVDYLINRLPSKPNHYSVTAVDSTAVAAQYVYEKKAQLAITNELGKKKFQLTTLAEYGRITMIWSVFERKKGS